MIIYDFAQGESPSLGEVQYGDRVNFKVTNVNRFIYQVKIMGKNLDYHPEVPYPFSDIFKDEKPIESKVGAVSDQFVENQTTKEERQNPNVAFSVKPKVVTNLTKVNLTVKGLVEQVDKGEIDKEKVKNQTNQLEEEMKELSSSIIEEEEYKEKGAYLKMVHELHKKSQALHTAFVNLEKVKLYKNDLILLSKMNGLNEKKAKIELEKINENYSIESVPEERLNLFNQCYIGFMNTYRGFLLDEEVNQKFGGKEKEIETTVAPLLQEVETLKKAVDQAGYGKIFENIKTLQNELINKSNYTFVSNSIQAERDYLEFDLEISPRPNHGSGSVLDTRSFPHRVTVLGGIQVDFSTGLVWSIGLHDRSYSTSFTSSDSMTQQITQDKYRGAGQVAVGAFMHISQRKRGGCTPALSLGLGVNSTDLKETKIYFGPSVILGKKERAVLSTGLGLSFVDFLKGKYELTKDIPTGEMESAITEKLMRPGIFFGISVNLTNSGKDD